jgi:hypothetical protein
MNEPCHSGSVFQRIYAGNCVIDELTKEGIEITTRVIDIIQGVLDEYGYDNIKRVKALFPTADEIRDIYKSVKSKILKELR